MNVALMISRRLRLSGNGRGPSRSGLIIAVTGIALALAVMMLSLAVVIGFKDAIAAKVKGFEADLTLIPVPLVDSSGKVVKPVEESVPTATSMIHDIVDGYAMAGDSLRVAAVLDRPGILKTDSDFLGVIFRGYGAAHPMDFEESNMLAGRMPQGYNETALSTQQASRLGIKVGDRIFTHFITDGAVKTRRFTVTGIYSSNFGEYDKTLAYTTVTDLAKIPDIGSNCIEVRGVNPAKLDRACTELQRALDSAFAADEISEPYIVQTLQQRGATFFNWLSMLDTNVIVILVLMACVSGFTLISSLIILILERVRLIGVLKSLGAGNRLVRGVFLWLGLRIIFWGLLIGNIVGLGLIFAQSAWHFIPLDAETYYLAYVPVKISLQQVLMLNAGVALGGTLLMLVPASIISRIFPSRVMRYE